jgi:hypothetical protein
LDIADSVNPGSHILLRRSNCARSTAQADRARHKYVVKVSGVVPKTDLLLPGDRCGAICVDLNFMRWLHQKLGDTNYLKLSQNLPKYDVGSHTIVGRDLKVVMDQFEHVKKAFKGRLGEDEGDIRLPGDLNNLHNPANGIEDGEVRITELVPKIPSAW